MKAVKWAHPFLSIPLRALVAFPQKIYISENLSEVNIVIFNEHR